MFGQLVAAAPARALLHVQRLAQEAGRGPLPEAPVRTAGVLGAGESGSAFAYLLARADLPVRVKDRKRTAVTAARQAVEAHLRHDAEHGRLPRAEAGRRAARVDGAHGFGGFGTLDLLVAAVGDRPAMVLRALRDAEEHTGERCVLAAASPLVQVGEVQAALAHPERVVGLHLFEPIDTLPLLEIAAGPATDAETLARCRELARRMGRVPVQVADRPGFLAPRLLAAYFAEAVRLLDEGASVQQVDRALEAFGFAMGPFRRMDAVGAARALRLMERLGEALGEHLLPAPVVRRLGEGEGFYRYRRGEPAGPNPRLPSGLSGLGAEHEELIRSRLLALLLNEAARAVEEGVADADAADLAAVHGLGFPRAHGGPLFHAAREEPGALRERLLTLERRFGTRFAPAPMVHRLLDGGERGSAVDSPTGHGQPGVL